MRHSNSGKKLGRTPSHRKALFRNMASAMITYGKIRTTEVKAKELRRVVEPLITLALRNDLHSRRLAIAYLNDKELVREIFEKVEQGMFKDRPGGYTRIMKLGYRKGDNAPMVIMELVTEPVVFKKKGEEAEEAPKAKKAAPKKVEAVEDAAEEAKEEAVEVIEADAEEAVEAEAAEAAEEKKAE